MTEDEKRKKPERVVSEFELFLARCEEEGLTEFLNKPDDIEETRKLNEGFVKADRRIKGQLGGAGIAARESYFTA